MSAGSFVSSPTHTLKTNKVSRQDLRIYASEVQLDQSKLYFDINGFLSEFTIAIILIIYRHSLAFYSVANPVNLARLASSVCSIMGIDPHLIHIDAVGAYGMLSRFVPALATEEEDKKFRETQGDDKAANCHAKTVLARSFTRAISTLLSEPGVGVLVLQGNDTFSSNWTRFISWIEHQNPLTIVIFAFHYYIVEANPSLKDLCQVHSKWTHYAVFTFRDIIDFEQDSLNCTHIQALKIYCLARQEHRDQMLQHNIGSRWTRLPFAKDCALR